MMSVASTRLVLFPQGIAADLERACDALLRRCGARPAHEPSVALGADALASQLAGLRPQFWAHPPVVLLTSPVPVAERVLALRERYERSIPELRQADWWLFVHGPLLPFVADSSRWGTFDFSRGAPIWIALDGERYLIVSADSCVEDITEGTAALDDRRSPSRSGTHRIGVLEQRLRPAGTGR